MEPAEAGGGSVGAGHLLVAGHDHDGLRPQPLQIARGFAQDVGIAAGERQLDHFDGAIGIAVAQQDFQLAADAEGSVGKAHGGGPAEQDHAQRARRGRLRHHGGRCRLGRPRRREPVRKKHVVDPGRLAVGAAGAQKPVRPFRQEGDGRQFGQDQQRQQRAAADGQAPESSAAEKPRKAEDPDGPALNPWPASGATIGEKRGACKGGVRRGRKSERERNANRLAPRGGPRVLS